LMDKWAARGQDFKCQDPQVNQNGGVLVITTSICGRREWNQWLGRTARQDRNGRYAVFIHKDEDLQDLQNKGKVCECSGDVAKCGRCPDKVNKIVAAKDQKKCTSCVADRRNILLHKCCENFYEWHRSKEGKCSGTPCDWSLSSLLESCGELPKVFRCDCKLRASDPQCRLIFRFSDDTDGASLVSDIAGPAEVQVEVQAMSPPPAVVQNISHPAGLAPRLTHCSSAAVPPLCKPLHGPGSPNAPPAANWQAPTPGRNVSSVAVAPPRPIPGQGIAAPNLSPWIQQPNAPLNYQWNPALQRSPASAPRNIG